jgi:hypothetical protein
MFQEKVVTSQFSETKESEPLIFITSFTATKSAELITAIIHISSAKVCENGRIESARVKSSFLNIFISYFSINCATGFAKISNFSSVPVQSVQVFTSAEIQCLSKISKISSESTSSKNLTLIQSLNFDFLKKLKIDFFLISKISFCEL